MLQYNPDNKNPNQRQPYSDLIAAKLVSQKRGKSSNYIKYYGKLMFYPAVPKLFLAAAPLAAW